MQIKNGKGHKIGKRNCAPKGINEETGLALETILTGLVEKNRSSQDNDRSNSQPNAISNGNVASDSVPDLVAAHSRAPPGEVRRDSDGSIRENTTADNVSNTAEEEARKKERERRRRRRKRQERRKKRYRRIVIRKEKLAGNMTSSA